MKPFQAILIVLTLCSVPYSTVLGDAAAAMKPGEWKELPTTGLNDQLFFLCGAGDLFGYTHEAVWNPGTEQLLFIGQGHNEIQKFITYSAVNNVWTVESKPSWDCSVCGASCIGHAYDHNAIDPVNGNFYFQKYYSNQPHKYNIATKIWSDIPVIPFGINIAFSLEYFTEIKGLVWHGSTSLYVYNEMTKQWSSLSTNLATGSYHNFSKYNPVRKVCIFGGGNGSRAVYKLDSALKFTRLSDAPFDIASWNTITTYDPLSGKFLMIPDNGDFYEYEVSTDTYRKLSVSLPFTNDPNGNKAGDVVATPASKYGVVIFVMKRSGNHKVYLYKHSQGTSGLVRPELTSQEGNPFLSVFPNPYRGQGLLHLETPAAQGGALEITELRGTLITHLPAVGGRVSLDGGKLPSGVYCVRWVGRRGERSTRPLVVVR